MVRPDQEAKDRNSNARHGYELVAENALARKARHNLGDHSHRGQNHNVNRGMGIKPKQVLKQKRVAAPRGIEDTEVERAFQHHQHQRHRDHRSPQQLNDAGSVVRPDEQRQTIPGHARGPHAVNRHDEIQPGQY